MTTGKTLKKNHFRYNTHPSVLKNNGKGHIGWVSAKRGHKEKMNIITHADIFFNMPTKKLTSNPEKSGRNTKQSKASSPRWFDDKYLSKPKGTWKMSRRDNKTLRKANKKFERTGKWA